MVLLWVGLVAVAFCYSDLSAAEWSAVTEARVLFTDNVFELSAARRLALSEDPSQPVIVSLSQPSDVVWDPSVDLKRTSWSSFGKTELSFKAHGFLYTYNPIFDHGDYRVQINQQVASRTFVLLRYRYVPNQFLGPSLERQSGSFQQAEERVTSHTWRMQLEQQLNDHWSVTLVGRYGLRLYNQSFSERDTTFYTIGPRLRLYPTRWLRLTLDYLYEQGFADGRAQPQYKDDISYRQQFVSFGAMIRLLAPLSLELIYVFRDKEFTSDIVGDPLRGNVDNLHQGTAELHYDLSESATVTVGFQRTLRASSVASREFFNTNASLGVQYRF
ncbi:MAG: hypothetical protein P0111_02815 [Nitrospira sp.]|nr:hypothetical protein [Nitrospira sp.]